MALKAESFIVALRGNDDLSFLNGQLADRQLKLYQVDPKYRYLSSTLVRSAIQSQNQCEDLLCPTVEWIIKQQSLYGFVPDKSEPESEHPIDRESKVCN